MKNNSYLAVDVAMPAKIMGHNFHNLIISIQHTGVSHAV